MQSRKRKQKPSKQQSKRKDWYAEAEKANKRYHDLEKVLNKLLDALLESSIALGSDMKRPVTVGELINFMAFTQSISWFKAAQVEARCVQTECLLEDTWDMLTNVSKRVTSKADMAELELIKQRLSNMRKDDAHLNEKVERVEPFLESFESFLQDKGVNPKDLFNFKSKLPTNLQHPF